MSKSDTVVLWLTGLSGAGKTTIGRKLYSAFKELEANWIILDGDLFRSILGNDLGHDLEDRIKNAYRISRMCAYLSTHDINVVCCTMSLYPEIWKWNRENIPGYQQIYLKTSQEVLIQRDPKGLYGKALNGEEDNIVGLHLPFNEPEDSDLVLQNDQSSDAAIQEKVDHLLSFVKKIRCG